MNEDLYQQALLDLARAAATDRRLEAPQATATLDNPLCGDRVTIEVRLEGGRVAALGHAVRGCALCQAATGLIAAHAPGTAPAELTATAQAFAAMLKSEAAQPVPSWPEAGAFLPVRTRKSRHDCALLPFQALASALKKAEEPA